MNVFVVVSYDISDDRRRLRVSSEIENFGKRVQKSIFECHLGEDQLDELKQRIEKEICPDQDRVRYYRLCPKDRKAVLLDGTAIKTRDLDYFMV